jgi:hypothetical protein
MTKNKIMAGLVSLSVGLSAVAMVAFANDNEAQSVIHPMPPVGSQVEFSVRNNGAAKLSGLKVTSISGSTLVGEAAFTTGKLNVTVTTDSNTKFFRRFESAASLSQLSVGDYITVSGTLSVSGNAFTLAAKTVQDNSIQFRTGTTFNGSVTSVTSSSTFVLASKDQGALVVTTNGATKIYLNNALVTGSQVVVGSNVTVTGLFNNAARTVLADTVHIKSNAMTQKTIFEGTLKSVSSTTVPASVTVTISGKDMTVNVPVGISIVNARYLPTTLSTFKAGDKVRIYGMVNATNNLVIDASILRDATVR